MESILQQIEKAAQALVTAGRELETAKKMAEGLPDVVAQIQTLAEQKRRFDDEMRQARTSVLATLISLVKALNIADWFCYARNRVSLSSDGTVNVPSLVTGHFRPSSVKYVASDSKLWGNVCSVLLCTSNLRVRVISSGTSDEQKQLAAVRMLVEQLAQSIPANGG